MDFLYEYSGERSETPKPANSGTDNADSAAPTPKAEPTETPQQQRVDLQTEFQETFKAFSNSPWGAKLGGWWSTARKQGESYYETARKEAEKREAEAAKTLEDVRKQVAERAKTVIEATEEQLDNIVNEEKKAERQKAKEDALAASSTLSREDADAALQENENFINRFRSEAAKRLQDIQKAEDAADEALLRFGTNIRNFLKDAVSIAAPEPSSNARASEVLFESKDNATGKRVFHTSRLDAQLHVIHTTYSSFTSDPSEEGDQYGNFKKDFDIDKKTDDIAKALETYQELRTAMEKLVPEKVDYKDFWTRYYFLRHVVEVQEEKRREMLKASAAANGTDEEQVGWDEDSDEESSAMKPSTPQINEPSSTNKQKPLSKTETAEPDTDTATLKPSRRSHDEKSVADSDASYDLVSGAASQATGSPKEKGIKSASEDSDEDWE